MSVIGIGNCNDSVIVTVIFRSFPLLPLSKMTIAFTYLAISLFTSKFLSFSYIIYIYIKIINKIKRKKKGQLRKKGVKCQKLTVYLERKELGEVE